MRIALLSSLSLVLLAPSAGAQPSSIERVTFLGWHPSGHVHYLALDQGPGKPPLVRVCRSTGDDLPSAWPPAVSIGPGILCADLTDEAAGAKAIDFAKHETAANKPVKTSPWGLKVELAVEGTKHTLTVSDGPTKKQTLPAIESPEPLKLGEVLWRKDGAAVAIALDAAKKPEKGALARRDVVVAEVGGLLVGGPAGRKVAQAKEKEAQALMRKRDWSGAGRLLDEAIAADPSFAPARYARAAAEAQGGIGRTAMIENLTWLKTAAATDPTAKKLLEQAKKDPVFDAWCGEAEVRELLGLPPVSSMDVPARLTERTATWTLQGASCKSPWLTLVFAKGVAGKDGKISGKGTLEIAESCKGKKTKQKQPFTWTQTPAGPFVLSTKAIDIGETKVPAQATLVLDDGAQQLKLKPEGEDDALGTFEPGVAHVEDSVL